MTPATRALLFILSIMQVFQLMSTYGYVRRRHDSALGLTTPMIFRIVWLIVQMLLLIWTVATVIGG